MSAGTIVRRGTDKKRAILKSGQKKSVCEQIMLFYSRIYSKSCRRVLWIIG